MCFSFCKVFVRVNAHFLNNGCIPFVNSRYVFAIFYYFCFGVRIIQYALIVGADR